MKGSKNQDDRIALGGPKPSKTAYVQGRCVKKLPVSETGEINGLAVLSRRKNNSGCIQMEESIF